MRVRGALAPAVRPGHTFSVDTGDLGACDALSGEVGARLEQRVLADGVLTISGEAPDLAARRRLVARLRTLGGVERVEDRLCVEPGQPMADADLERLVAATLSSEPALGGLAIGVRAAGGVLHLEGTVWSLSHRRLAGVLAWWAPGTRDVDNRIQVSPPERDGDHELADAVRLVLEKDPLVDASQLTVQARAGEVTLRGCLPSPEQRRLAVLDAFYVDGVDEVREQVALWAPEDARGAVTGAAP